MVDLLTQDQVNQLTGATDVGVKFPVEGAVPVWTTEYPHHICGFYQVVKGGNDRTYISGRREVQFEGAIDVYELKHHTATTDIADYKKVGTVTCDQTTIEVQVRGDTKLFQSHIGLNKARISARYDNNTAAYQIARSMIERQKPEACLADVANIAARLREEREAVVDGWSKG